MQFLQDYQTACRDCLHNPTHRMAKVINGLIVFLVILSVTVIPLHFFPGLDYIHNQLVLFDKIAVTVFTVEYMARLWSAEKPFRYAFSWWGLVDLVAIAPFYLGELGLVANPEIFMLLRILRIFKLGQIYENERTAIRRSAKDQHGAFEAFADEYIQHVAQKHWITFVGSLSFCLLLTSGALMAMVFLIPISLILGLVVGILLLILAGFMFTKLWLDFNYDLIYLTNRRIIWQERELFGSITNEISYDAVSNVKPDDSSFWHWLFGYGDICVETAAEKGTMIFDNARKPRVAVKVISENRMKTSGSIRKASGPIAEPETPPPST